MSCLHKLKGLTAAAALAAFSFAASVNAAVITLDQNVVGAFETDFTPLPGIPDLSFYTAGTPIVLQVDYSVHVQPGTLLPGERGFAATGFTIQLGPGVTDAGGGWQPNIATVDSNGALPGGIVPAFATNVDGGTPGDLVGILAAIAGGITNANDPRTKIGQDGGISYIGSVFLQWDGVTTSTISTDGVLMTSLSTTGQFNVPALPAPPSITALVSVPEPTTVALAGLALCGLAFRRRHAA